MSVSHAARPSGDADIPDASNLPREVAEALAAVEAAVGVLAGLDVTGVDGRAAAVIAGRLAAVTSRATVARVRLLSVIDADGLWALPGEVVPGVGAP